jgi:hypothetical protein
MPLELASSVGGCAANVGDGFGASFHCIVPVIISPNVGRLAVRSYIVPVPYRTMPVLLLNTCSCKIGMLSSSDRCLLCILCIA